MEFMAGNSRFGQGRSADRIHQRFGNEFKMNDDEPAAEP